MGPGPRATKEDRRVERGFLLAGGSTFQEIIALSAKQVIE
jgi:hypothetical protein